MKTAKVPNLQIIPPKSESGLYETDTFMPKMHQVCVAVGKRASGKSTAIVNLIERLKFDYCIAVSPTMNSNKELMDRLKIEHTFEDVDDPSVIDKIKDIVKGEAEDLERYKEELKRYNKLMKDLKEGKYMDDDLLLQFFSDEGHFMKPTHRWNGMKPRIACIFDDMLGSGIYSRPRKLNGLSTYSRHVGN
jgi:thioester reductase-like protein